MIKQAAQSSMPSLRTRRATLLSTLSILLMLAGLALTGCAGSARGSIDVTVHPAGNVTIEAKVPGTLTDLTQRTLSAGDWQVAQAGGAWVAERTMPSKDLDAATNQLTNAVCTVFWEQEGFLPAITDEPSLKVDETNLLAAKIVTLTYVGPVADVAPTKCLTCNGSGTQDCPSCVGGTLDCEQCGGSGTLQCSTCEGSGSEECWWCDGTGTDYWGDTCSECDGAGEVECTECGGGGEVECDYCYGSGEVECYECDGMGSWTCETCGGSGEPNESDIMSYRAAIDNASVDVNLHMPGMVLASSADGDPNWSLSGTDAVSGDEFTATSVVINWPVFGGALGVLALIVVAAIALARRGKKAKPATSEVDAAASEGDAASMGEVDAASEGTPASAGDSTFADTALADSPTEVIAAVEAPTGEAMTGEAADESASKPARKPKSKAAANYAAGNKFCTQCGEPAAPGAAFCTTCGAKFDK